eukprot:8919940-Alexandrium_andersonii.AAC.1
MITVCRRCMVACAPSGQLARLVRREDVCNAESLGVFVSILMSSSKLEEPPESPFGARVGPWSSTWHARRLLAIGGTSHGVGGSGQ